MADDGKKKPLNRPRGKWQGRKKKDPSTVVVESTDITGSQTELEGMPEEEDDDRIPPPFVLAPGEPIPPVVLPSARAFTIIARGMVHYRKHLKKVQQPMRQEQYIHETDPVMNDIELITDSILPQLSVQTRVPFEPDETPDRSVTVILKPLLRTIRTLKEDPKVGEVILDICRRVADYGTACAAKGLALGYEMRTVDAGRVATMGCVALRKKDPNEKLPAENPDV